MSQAASTSRVAALLVGACCAIVCLASLAQAQYANFDSDSSSELGKMMRNAPRGLHPHSQRAFNQQAAALAAAAAAAASNPQNQQLGYAPSQSSRRNFGASHGAALNSAAAGYAPNLEAALSARGSGSGHANFNSELSSANNNDDDDSASYGSSGYGSDSQANNNDDADEGSSLEPAQHSGLEKAASGYPGAHSAAAGDQHDFNGDSALSFDGANFGSDFGPDSSFDSETKRAKSASSPVHSSKNSYESSDDDAAIPQYGPNSAVNADGEEVLDGARHGAAGYAPAQSDDNDNDDE